MKPTVRTALCLTAIFAALHAWGGPAAPGKNDAPPAHDSNVLPAGVHLQSKYETLDGEYSITFTAPNAMLYEDRSQKITGRYMSPGFMGRDVLVFLEKPRAASTSYALAFTSVADDILYDGQGTLLATAATREKAKTLLPDLLHRDQAEAIAASCRLYALNHGGKFPARIADVPPSYSPGGNIFAGQTPEKIIGDYEYLGAGATLDDTPAKPLLRSKYTTSSGGKIEVPLGTPENVLLNTKYESVDGGYSITFTGLGSVLYESRDRKTTGNYMIHPPPGVSILVSLDDKPTLRDLTFAGEGILYDGRTMIAVAPVKEKARTLIPDFQHLMDAEIIADYCHSYALDHDGKYPAQLADIVPDLVKFNNTFSGLTPEKAIEQYDYLGAGLTKNDDPGKIILRSRYTTSEGKHIVAPLDGKSRFEPAR